jgi:hypothetical protein
MAEHTEDALDVAVVFFWRLWDEMAPKCQPEFGEFSRKGGRCPSRQRGERDSDLLSDGQGEEDYDTVRLEEPEAVGGTLTSLA